MTHCPSCKDETLKSLADALAVDDLDRAVTLGLLDARPEQNASQCGDCRTRARLVIEARDERIRALAARERYRTRQARLAERAEVRARKRAPAASMTSKTLPGSVPLPPAAAAALARAKARVAAKPQPE
jgi:hypothetical protein